MLNRITMTGRLVADPELRRTQSGVSVTSFRIANDRDYGKGEEKETDFFDVVAWRSTAEFICKYFTKGRMISVDGRLAILVGDIRTKGSFYSMQHDLMRVGQMEAFIVKGQYNCVSDTRSYKKPFIPVVTEYLLLFHKQDALFFPFAVRRETTVDLRKEDIPGLTWHHLIRLTMEELSGRAKLSDLGDRLAAHPKAKKNPHFRDRIRATAYEHPGQYISCGNGFYALNYAVA